MENFSEKLPQIEDAFLKAILEDCYAHLENEYLQNSYPLISNLSTSNLVKLIGIFLEKQNARSKLQNKAKEKICGIPQSNDQSNRQGLYLSDLECFNRLFIEKFPSGFSQVASISNNLPYSTQIEQDFYKLVSFLYQKEALCNFVDFVIYDKWDYKIQGETISIMPKDEISKKNYLNSANINFKKKAELNYVENIVSDFLCLSLKIDPVILQREKTQFVNTFLGYHKDANIFSIDLNHSKELVKNCNLDFVREFLTEQAMFNSYHLNQGVLRITLKDGRELNVSNILCIGVVLKRISQLYIKRIDIAVETEQKREDDQMLQTPTCQELNLRALLNRNNPAELKKIQDELQDKKEQIENEMSDNSFQPNLDNNIFIVEFELKNLKEIIKSALNLPDYQDIEMFLEIFKYEPDLYDRTRRYSRLNFQSLFILNNQVIWYPNMWAFVGLAEKLFESLLDKGLISLGSNSPISTLTENFIYKLFKDSCFHTLSISENDESLNKQIKELKNPNDGKIKGDLDGFAFDEDKAGIHLELKLTGIRNDIQLKEKWKKDKIFDAINRQIPNIREFIEDFPDIIRQKFNLLNDFEIDINKIYSLIISNSFDFDHEEFNGYLKVNLLELTVLLTDTEIFLHEYGDYLKIWIKRIKKQENCLVPKEYLEWAENKRESPFLNKSSQEMSFQDWEVIKNFVDRNKKLFWKNPKQKTIQELVENLKNNVIFDYLDDIRPELKYGRIEIGSYTFKVPDLKLV